MTASAEVVLLYTSFWVFARRQFLVRNQRFGTTFVSHIQSLEILKIGHTNSPDFRPENDAG
jgi:hypothetical protein